MYTIYKPDSKPEIFNVEESSNNKASLNSTLKNPS